MKDYTMLNYSFTFGDHLSQVSNEAKLLYIEMMFFAVNGFVANPKAILDSRNYDISVLNELIANGDVLKLPDRSEVFITSFFIHNKGFNTKSWWQTPFAVYWKGKLFIKENGVATFKTPEKSVDPLEKIKVEKKYEKVVSAPIVQTEKVVDTDLNDIFSFIDQKKESNNL